MKKILYIILGILSCATSSCIKNDIPYPYQFLGILSIEGEGFTTSINELTRTATLSLEETTDICNVVINTVECSDEAKLDRAVEGTFDLSTPLNVTLYNYQSYAWTIEAKQTISRVVSIDGQIGAAVIDEENNKIYISISDTVDPLNVTVTELKLGPEGITETSPTKEELTSFPGSYRKVEVTYHGRTEEWFIYASFEKATVTMTLCTTLATKAWLETSGDTSTEEECGYKYRKFGDSDWTTLVVTPQSGFFSTEISGLTPETTYEFQSYIGSVTSVIETRTTESTPQLDNSGFEVWELNGWVCPYLSTDEDPVWDTGNQGANTGSATLTESSTDIRPGSTGVYSAQLTAKSVGIPGLYTKFAAGNMFVGSYSGTEGTNGVIAFGYPFTQRPIALRGWYKYTCGAIDNIGSTLPTDISNTLTLNESPDIGVIYVALGTWESNSYQFGTNLYLANAKSPFYVYTGDTSTFFNHPTDDDADDDVVAYGALRSSESVSEWTQFEIPLTYYDKEILPTHIIIVASTSFYGDYFTGSTKSQMWLDDFELVYE